MKFGIAGFGFVGQAVYGSVKNTQNVAIFDKYKKIGSFQDLLQQPFIFCCLPTPQAEDGSQDFSEYFSFFNDLVQNKYNGILIVKSTVLYENIEPYLEKLNIVFNPEFLNQRRAVDDFKNQRVIIYADDIAFKNNISLA